jgi:hypothetical protein
MHDSKVRKDLMDLSRDPIAGLDLAWQRLLSRFESAASVIKRHGKRLGGHARRVPIDLDPTDDPTNGVQQLSFFNSHYDNACYLPVMRFVSFDDESDQYLCAAVLRPYNATATAGAVGILRRRMALIRRQFRKARKDSIAAQYPSHGDSRVVVENARGNSAEVREDAYVTFQKYFGGFRGKRHYEAIVGVRQAHRRVVRLCSTPAMITSTSPKSACTSPARCASGTNISRPRRRSPRTYRLTIP